MHFALSPGLTKAGALFYNQRIEAAGTRAGRKDASERKGENPMRNRMLSLIVCLLAAMMMVLPAMAEETGLTWDMAEEILTHISDPVFPDYEVNVLDFGAVPNDDQLDTAAIQAAIDHVSEQGGGKVIVPSGTFDTGAITLKSNVNLCLESEDTLLLYTREINHDNYPLVYCHFEGSGLYNWSPLVYAYQAENIALTGKGTLDGHADKDNWWNWCRTFNADGSTTRPQSADTSPLRKQTDARVPFEERVYGEGHYLRPNFFQVLNCTNVLVEGVTFKNSPMWIMNPVETVNFTARGVTVDTHGYNNDGCDPENCNYVLIENCYFNTGDDCIAIKAGRNADGRALGEAGWPSQNIIIRNNNFANGHGGIAMGSEMSGGIRNVFADNNTFDSPTLNYALRFKTNAQRGGYIENVYLRNSTVKSVGQASVHATMLYDTGRDGDYLPYFRNITIENLTSAGGQYGIFMEAFDEVPITGLVLRNVSIEDVDKSVRALNWEDPVMENVTINGKSFPAPVEAHIVETPVDGATIHAAATQLGGDNADISYTWLISDTRDGAFTECATGDTFTCTGVTGKFLKVIATDKQGSTSESIAYEVLASAAIEGVEDADTAAYVADAISRGYVDAEGLDITREITNRDVARMIARLWGLTAPEADVEIADLAKDDPDYGVIAAVVEGSMMNLKDPSIAVAQGTLYNAAVLNDEANKRTCFYPDAVLTREELGYLSILACGVPYNETLGTAPKCSDASDIDSTYKDDIGASTYFGFMTVNEEGLFLPKSNATMEDLIKMIVRIADFNNM